MRGLLLFLMLLVSFSVVGQGWERVYGGSDNEVILSSVQTDDGGFLSVGHKHYIGATDKDIYLLKTSSEGDLQWEKIIDLGPKEDIGTVITPALDSGYVIGGSTESLANAYTDFYFAKISMNGKVEWQRTWEDSLYSDTCGNKNFISDIEIIG